jgi:hypothetical protein
LRDRFHFFQLKLLDHPILLMVDSPEEAQSPAVIAKQLLQVRSRSTDEVVYVTQALSAINRRRLIEHKVAFIIPGNQLYLPLLGLDLREHLKRLRDKQTILSPATQVLLLKVLLERDPQAMTPKDSAIRLGYSPMTMTRAFDELESLKIGQFQMVGRQRQVRFPLGGKEIWQRALPHLTSPVRSRCHIMDFDPGEKFLLAGLSALAELTDLVEPTHRVYALPQLEWQNIIESRPLTQLSHAEPGSVEIQIWKYPPKLLAKDHLVDPLSLVLSLRHEPDERITVALEQLQAEMSW